MRAAWLTIFTLGLVGCAVVNFLPGEEPTYLVIRGGAPFWTYGPQQAGLPDERLDLGDPVRVVRWEYGFSRVKLEAGLTGYMANEDLEKAPDGTIWRGDTGLPAVAPPRGPEVSETEPTATARVNKPEREVYRGPIVDDAPLPLEEPDMDVIPDDAPTLE